MNADRKVRLWGQAVELAAGTPVTVDHVCTAMIAVTGGDRAAITVTLAATPRETVYTSDATAAVLEELSLTLGEGPSIDAVVNGPVLAGDLSAADIVARWPVFAPAAVVAGARAMFALPLRVGGIRLGVLDVYRAQPGDLDRDQLADALVLADTVCALLLDTHDHDPARRNGHWPEQTTSQHHEVHQATGMITVQLGVTVAVALVRLRAHAYAHDRRLRDVAADVVNRRLRLTATGEP